MEAPPGDVATQPERCAAHGLVLRADGTCLRCVQGGDAATGRSAMWIGGAAVVLAAAAAVYFVFLRSSTPHYDGPALRSPFSGGVAGFVKVDALAAEWNAFAAEQGALADEMLEAMGVGAAALDGLSGIGDFQVYFDGSDVVLAVGDGDAGAFTATDLSIGGGELALYSRQLDAATYVGTKSALEDLRPPGDWRDVPAADLATIEHDAFIGLVVHAGDTRIITMSTTPRGAFLTMKDMPVSAEMKSGLQIEGRRNDIDVEFDTAGGDTRIAFRGEPFSALGLVLAILIPATMKYMQRAGAE